MGTASRQSRTPACASRFLVGRDMRGRWIVRDEKGLVGGLFVDRAAAVRFAMFESDYVPGAVCCVPDGVLSVLGPLSEPGPADWHSGAGKARPGRVGAPSAPGDRTALPSL